MKDEDVTEPKPVAAVDEPSQRLSSIASQAQSSTPPPRSLRELGMTVFVSRADVQQAVGCGRSTAAMHLRRAAGKTDSSKSLVRVPLQTWEEYAAKMWGPKANVSGTAAPRSQTPSPTRAPRKVDGASNVTPLRPTQVQLTMPRLKKR